MIKSVLLHANEDDAMDARLQVALDVCRATGAHLSCLHVTPYNAYVAFDPVGGLVTQGAILGNLQEVEDTLRKRIESHLSHEDVIWDWSSVDGDVANTIIDASGLSDLIIISQYDKSDNRLKKPLPIVDDVAVHASCPVLVVPKGINQITINNGAVIGWNASPESAHAVRAATPLLQMASFVHIVSVGEDGADYPQTNANTYLARHGIKSDIHELPGSNRNAAQVLHDFAVSKQANFLVIGAYSRSRFRETLLGGATRSLLSTSQIPLLLAH
jgi:nucleotide-binding universal stress UspA family protein